MAIMQELQCGECTPEDQEAMNSQAETQPQPLLISSTKFDTRRSLNTEQLVTNTFVERKSAQDIVSKGRLFASYAQSSPSSIDGRARDETEQEREVRQLLGYTKSLFPNGTGVRRCPFSDLVNGPCNGRHCEPFWKPILKQEVRRTPLCGEDCKFCHDPRHFPDDEWVKLHVHRTPAARRRAKKPKKNKDALNMGEELQ